MRTALVCAISLMMMLTVSCAGREPVLVEKEQSYDSLLKCEHLETEVNTCTTKILEKHHAGKKKMEETIGAAVVGVVILPPVLLAMDLKKADYKEMGALMERRNHLISLARKQNCPWSAEVETDDELMARAEAEYKELKHNPQAMTAAVSPKITKPKPDTKTIGEGKSVRIALFPVLAIDSYGGKSLFTKSAIRAIETICDGDSRLELTYSYKRISGPIEKNEVFSDNLAQQVNQVWIKRTVFSQYEVDWDKMKDIGNHIDADLALLIYSSGAVSLQVYIYDFSTHESYSQVNPRISHYDYQESIKDEVLRVMQKYFKSSKPSILDSGLSPQPDISNPTAVGPQTAYASQYRGFGQLVLTKNNPLYIHQDASKIKNNNGKIIEQKLIEVDSKFKNEIDYYKIKYLTDGLIIVGFIVKPKKIINKLPVIIFNRGGNREFYKITKKTLISLSPYASQNYVILASQYRGNDGGQGREEFGGKDVNDVLSLIPLAQSISFMDSSRIGMLGASRGGMMTYLAIKEGADIRAAAVISGVTDLVQTYRERDQNMKNVLTELVGYDEDQYRIRSAYYWPEKLNVPLLILHGENDWRVKVNQAQKLSKKLTEAGKVHELVVYPRGDHGLKTHKYDRNRRVFKWFETYLKQ